jgi:hypothetical protein
MLNKGEGEEHGREMPQVYRAGIYMREPGPTDPDKPLGEPTIDQQRMLCRCVAALLRAEVIREFIDAGPFVRNRPILREMLGLADTRLDYLIVFSLDRLASGVDEAFEMAWRLGVARTVVVPVCMDEELRRQAQDPPA